MNITTISTKGQVTIPEYIRSKAKLTPGTKTFGWTLDEVTGQLSFHTALNSSNVVTQLAGSIKTNLPYVPYSKARESAGQDLGKKYDQE